MANSYTQFYYQFVFAPKGRQNFLLPEFENELQMYITGIVQHPTRNCKMLAINNTFDHMHVFVGAHPSIAPAKLVQEIKGNSSKFINEKGWLTNRFEWQEGYGGFSYSRSQIDVVCKYVLNQKEHHKIQSFREEYVNFLNKFGISYDDCYLFEFYE